MCNVMCALQIIMPASRKQLGLSERALKGWDKCKSSISSTRLTRDLEFAIAEHILQSGYVYSALALLISWAGYLHASKALNPTRDLVALSGDSRICSYPLENTGVCIPDSRMGPFQMVALKEHIGVLLLAPYKTTAQKEIFSRETSLTYHMFHIATLSVLPRTKSD